MYARYVCLILLLAAAMAPRQLIGQEPIGAQLDLGGRDWIPARTDLRIELSRPPASDEGRVIVLVGETDLTDLFREDGNALVYRSELRPLPAGESELRVVLVSADGFPVELGVWPVRVFARAGFERLEITAPVDLQTSSQLDENGRPDAPPADGEGATLQANLGLELARSGWRLATEASTLGVSEVEQALRFGERGDDADRFDLASYSVRLERGRGAVELGQVLFGFQRHLVADVTSRGVVARLPLGSRANLTIAGVNGSSIVGWSNFSGLERSEHQIRTAAIDFDVLPSRPGALRVVGSWLDGSLLPLSGFTQGDVTDAEESRGWGLQVLAQPNARFSLDGGFATSRFENPFDPLLAQGDDLVGVEPEERDARYLDVRIGLLSGALTDRELESRLDLVLSHERVDPQYRSVAAFAQSDRERNGAQLQAAVGPAIASVGHARSRDNLDDLPSVLETRTRQSILQTAVPLAELLDLEPGAARYAPVISYAFDRTRQLGAGVPIGGDFDETQVPDQVNESHLATFDWQGNRWSLGYELGYSEQDNRQPGRETADFDAVTQGLRLAVALLARFDLGFDLGRERLYSVAEDRVDYVDRYGVAVDWRITRRLSANGRLTLNEGESEPLFSESEAWTYDLETAYRFEWRPEREHGGAGQVFVRWSRQDLDARDLLFDFVEDRYTWALIAGLNLSFR
jgi:hypothetical protein